MTFGMPTCFLGYESGLGRGAVEKSHAEPYTSLLRKRLADVTAKVCSPLEVPP